MSGDDEISDVDFVVGEQQVEELPPPPARPAALRNGVIALAVVAVLGALVGLRLATSGSDPKAATSPTSVSSPATSSTVTVAPDLPVRVIPVSGIPGSWSIDAPISSTSTCPAKATCTVWPTAPAAVVTALRAAFPSATLRSATTELANRPGSFGPELIARLVVATAGDLRISITIDKPGGDADPAAGPPGSVNVSVGVPGFRVSIGVISSRGMAGVAPRTVRSLAVDTRLLVPQ